MGPLLFPFDVDNHIKIIICLYSVEPVECSVILVVVVYGVLSSAYIV